MTGAPRLRAVSIVAALALVGATPAAAGSGPGTPSERKLHGFVNESRSRKDLSELDLRRGLTRKAHRHSRHMATSPRAVGCGAPPPAF